MKKSIIALISIVTLSACNPDYRKGEPIITGKEQMLWPSTCQFTWEGNGKRGFFEDKCDNYKVGQKLVSD